MKMDGNLTALDNLPKADTSAVGLSNIVNWVLTAS